MPVTLNFTTIRDCDSNTGLSTSGQLGNLGAADFTPQQGASAREFNTTGSGGIGSLTATVPAGTFDSEVNDVSCWFLNPGFTNAGEPVLANVDSAVQLFLQSGTNIAYYNQGGGESAPNPLPGGWGLLRCNGSQTPDDTTGTWGAAQRQAVDAVGIRINALNDNDGKSDTAYGVDWFKYHNRIDVTGDDAGNPWTLERIAEISEAIGQGGGRWGLVLQTDIFFEIRAGMRVSNDGATDGDLQDENKYLFFNALATTQPYDFEVTNNALVRFGLKDADGASGIDYAVNGCQLRSVLGNPDLTIQSGGQFQFYGGRIQGYGTINLGSGGAGAIELINNDLFENTTTILNSTALTADNMRMHFRDGSEADIGQVLQVPVGMSNFRVFQCVDGFEFQVTMTAEQYIAGDNTFDAVIQEGDTLTLLDSVFDADKLGRVA